MKVILIAEVSELQDKIIFNSHLKKEGFLPIENENFAYEGEAHSGIFNTRAYIHEVVSAALEKSGFKGCKIVFEIGENPLEAYVYSKKFREFIEIKI